MAPVPLLRPGALLNDRFEVEKKIGEGTFSEIYRARDRQTSELVAIKVEKEDRVLKWESSVQKRLQDCAYVCRHIVAGEHDARNYLAMELLGSSLSDLRRRQPAGKLSMATTLSIGIQLLKAIQGIHALGYINRDIKPSNFCMGLGTKARQCFMVDFGLAKKYRDAEGRVNPARPVAEFRGTSHYASINAHKNKELGRRDDLWSLLYVLVEFCEGDLPWRSQTNKDRILEAKEFYNQHPERLLRSTATPKQLQDFARHLSSLQYEDDPDYEYLLGLLESLLEETGVQPDALFDWEARQVAPVGVAERGPLPADELGRRPLELSSPAQESGEISSAPYEAAGQEKAEAGPRGGADEQLDAEGGTMREEQAPEKELDSPRNVMGPHERGESRDGYKAGLGTGKTDGLRNSSWQEEKGHEVGEKRKRDGSREFFRNTSMRRDDSLARERSRFEVETEEERAKRREENLRRQREAGGTRVREKGKEWAGDRDRDWAANRDRDREDHRDREGDREGLRDREKDRDHYRDRDGGREPYKDRDGEREQDRDKYRDRDDFRDRERERESHRDREREYERGRNGDNRDWRRDDPREKEFARYRDSNRVNPRRGERDPQRDLVPIDRVCFDYLMRLRCKKRNCLFRHPARPPREGARDICLRFLDGKCPHKAAFCRRYHWTQEEESDYLRTGDLPPNAIRYTQPAARQPSRSYSRSASRRRSASIRSPRDRDPPSYHPHKTLGTSRHSSASEASDGDYRRADPKEPPWANQKSKDPLPTPAKPPTLEHLHSPTSGRSNVSDGEVASAEEVASAKMGPVAASIVELEPPAISMVAVPEEIEALEAVIERPASPGSRLLAMAMQSFDSADDGAKVGAGLELTVLNGGDKRPAGQGGSWPVGLLAKSPVEELLPAEAATDGGKERTRGDSAEHRPGVSKHVDRVRGETTTSPRDGQEEGLRCTNQSQRVELARKTDIEPSRRVGMAANVVRLRVSPPKERGLVAGPVELSKQEVRLLPVGGKEAEVEVEKVPAAREALQPVRDTVFSADGGSVLDAITNEGGVSKASRGQAEQLEPVKPLEVDEKPVAHLLQSEAAKTASSKQPLPAAERLSGKVVGIRPIGDGASLIEGKDGDAQPLKAEAPASVKLGSPAKHPREKAAEKDKLLGKKSSVEKPKAGAKGLDAALPLDGKSGVAKQTAPVVIKKVIIKQRGALVTPSESTLVPPSRKGGPQKGAPTAAALPPGGEKKANKGPSTEPVPLEVDPSSRPSSPAAPMLQGSKGRPGSSSARLLNSPPKPQTLPPGFRERSPLVAGKLEELLRARKLHLKQVDDRLWQQFQNMAEAAVVQCLDEFRDRVDQIEPSRVASYLLLQLKRRQASANRPGSASDKGRAASSKPSSSGPATPLIAATALSLPPPASPAVESSDLPTAPSTPARSGPPLEPPAHIRNPSLELPVLARTNFSQPGEANAPRNGLLADVNIPRHVSLEAEGRKHSSSGGPILDDATSGGVRLEEPRPDPVPSPRAVGKRSSLGRRTSTATLSRFGGKELDILERTGETKEGEVAVKSEEGSAGNVKRPKQGQQRLAPAPREPLHTELSPEDSASESSSFSSLFKEVDQGGEEDDGDEVNGPSTLHTAPADQWAASGTWANPGDERPTGHSRKRSAGSIANVSTVKRPRSGEEGGVGGQSEEVELPSNGGGVNAPLAAGSKVLTWYKMHMNWEHYPYALPDGGLLKTRTTDRYQSTATALLKALEIVYKVEVSRSTWAQQGPRNVFAELQLSSAKTKVTAVEPKGMAKKFFVTDDEGRKYWSNIKRGSTQPTQHHLVAVLQHDLMVLGLCPHLVSIEFTLGKKQAGSLLPNPGPCTCGSAPIPAPPVPMSPKGKARIGSPSGRDLSQQGTEDGFGGNHLGGSKGKRKNGKKGSGPAGFSQRTAVPAAVPTLDSPALLSPSSPKKRLPRAPSKKNLSSLGPPGPSQAGNVGIEAGAEWQSEGHEELAPAEEQEKSAEQAAFWEEIKGNVKSRELQNLSSVLVAGKRRRGT